MASSSTQTPQDLKQMVDSSQQDMDDMMNKLEKLHSLSEDDKTENALLRSRIDEQSQLIMILKQRTDETVLKIRSLERTNVELEDFRDHAQGELDMQLRKYNILDSRFADLASNHQEMIQIKDDYKRRNVELTKENERLLDENGRLFSKAICEKDQTISQLEIKAAALKETCASLDSRNKELEKCVRTTQDSHTNEMKDLKRRLDEAEERLKGTSAKLSQLQEGHQHQDEGMQRRLQQVTKEKDDLLDLAMQRGKLIQDKQTENKKLQLKIEQMEKAVRDTQDKFERESAAVNANLQVRRLRAELEEAEHKSEDAIREFDAFKKHSSKLLQQEKDLNAKLRHLVG